jgi:phage head maturation protease
MITRKQLPRLDTPASVAPSSIDVKQRTVDLVWSTGSKGLRSGPFGSFYESLDMSPQSIDLSRMANAPVLDSHDATSVDSILGSIQSIKVVNGQGLATIRFATDAKSESVFQKVQDGTIRNVSVGYRIDQMKDVSKPGDEIPSYLATRWTPMEISLVAVPFDSAATIRTSNKLNEVTIIGSAETTPQSAKKETRMNESARQERQRIQSIQNAVRAAKLDDSFAEELINNEATVEQASKEIFAKLEERQQPAVRANVSVGSGSLEDQRKAGIENALLHRANPRTVLTESGKFYRGMSLTRIAEDLMQGRPFGVSDQQVATRAMTTSDLPNILANVAEKAMRAEFQLQPPSFAPFTKSGILRNYKQANRLQLGEFPTLEEVKEHGEPKMGSVSESKETIQLKRFLKQIEFTKEMIVNDDLNALADFAVRGARSANRLESGIVYTDILGANPTMGDGNALFSSAHANYTGTGTAISVASLTVAWTMFRNQTTLDGLEYADLMPKYLICGPSKEVTALQVVSQNMLAAQTSNVNPFAGRLEVIVDPRITGNEWYLAGDPSKCDTIEVARLEGEDGPMVTADKGRIPGSMLITVEHSVGAAALDYRNLYKNVGA